jgi:serine/threonine-protein kinase
VAAVGDNGTTESTSQVEVPVIAGMSESEAAAKAQEANLGIKYMGEKESEEYEAGIIMEQDPVAGSKVDKNTTIYYYRSSGRTTITMPDVIGASLTDAQNALTSAGFSNLQVANAPSEEVPIGNVISVSPGVGENVGPTDLITLTVSTGSENAAKVTVSSYGGLPEDQAVAALQGMGLIVRIEYGSSDRVNVGDVIKQSISSGTEVSVGTEITLTVNNPDMIGQTGTTGGANIQTASWTTNSTLDAPSNYQGGPFRLVLQQTVNGQTVETTVDEGDYIDFPYQLLCKGAAGVSEGKVVMYELYDGDYISRASWPVVFSSAG